MCARKAWTACDRKTPAAKSSLSDARGDAASTVVSSFFSSSSTSSVASFSSRCATNLCSCSRSIAFCLSSSAWSLVSLSSILLISVSMEESVAMTFASRWRVMRRARVEARAVCASCCAEPALSQLPFISSGPTSAPPSQSTLVAEVAASTFFSTSTTFSATSRFTVASFRSAMPFLASPSFLVTASSRACSSLSCSMVTFADLSESRLAARRFMARKVFAPPTAVWAVDNADSRSLSALLA
mmetsp:Transcript_132603/g.369680  ORF Transcript_132603/g.369680 Transcript_132603/m.369680 type:complete len:242 (-) Transcript_132603:1393-2118(-)